jgi:hypothetical protein
MTSEAMKGLKKGTPKTVKREKKTPLAFINT